jgi:glycosyltransferase involved in cell wall biosynthesis
VLWFAPWFRSLAHIYGRGLTKEGHEVLVVTSTKHPEPAPSLVTELVCPARFYDPHRIRSVWDAERAYRRFRPDVVMTEQTTDPMFVALAQRMHPDILLVHDAKPHDHTHQVGGWRGTVHALGNRQGNDIVTFSRRVAQDVSGSAWKRPAVRVHQISLVSDFLDEDVPAFRPASERRDFVLMGRMAPYRNIDHVLAAWAHHVSGPGYRGDRLVIWGKGEWTSVKYVEGARTQDESVEWRSEVYRYADIAGGRFSGFKGSLCVYLAASQSGVQLLSAQLGVAPVVSDVGALREYQAPTLPVLDPRDVGGLVDVLDHLADPGRAAALGRVAQEFSQSNHSEAVAAKQLSDLLEDVVTHRSKRAS